MLYYDCVSTLSQFYRADKLAWMHVFETYKVRMILVWSQQQICQEGVQYMTCSESHSFERVSEIHFNITTWPTLGHEWSNCLRDKPLTYNLIFFWQTSCYLYRGPEEWINSCQMLLQVTWGPETRNDHADEDRKKSLFCSDRPVRLHWWKPSMQEEETQKMEKLAR
jgi:hypothetical protein